MHDLLDREMQDMRAAEAVALFCYQVKSWLGASAAVLGGLDMLVFGEGVGENVPTVRARICDELGFLGSEPQRKARRGELEFDFRGRQPGHGPRHSHGRRTHDR